MEEMGLKGFYDAAHLAGHARCKSLLAPLVLLLLANCELSARMGVGQVLLNLLIAMLTSTYDENKRDAQEGWKLHRARVLVRIDKSMTKEQRIAADKVFWQRAPEDPNKR
jgi:hypothetical protein